MKYVKSIVILLVAAGLGYYSWSLNTKPASSSDSGSVALQPSEPEAVRLLEKAASALKSAKVVRYEADYQVRGADTHIGGIIELDRNRNWIRMAVTDRRWPDFHEELFDAATDGSKVALASHMDMRYAHGAYPAQAGILRPGQSLLFQPFGRNGALETELASHAVHEGRRSVGDIECEVVYVKYGQPGEYSRWFFGPDGLPRRVERISSAYDDIPESQYHVKTLVMTDIELAPELVAANFQLERPEDYEDIELK